MGMYTELIFQGYRKSNLPEDIMVFIDYFFNTKVIDLPAILKLPEHKFFSCLRWSHLGHVSSFYFHPSSIRDTYNDSRHNSAYVFMRCDIKNYDNEIELFLDWIKPYMENFRAYSWYEEDEFPTIFKHYR